MASLRDKFRAQSAELSNAMREIAEQDEWYNKRLRTLQYVNDTAEYIEQVRMKQELIESSIKLVEKFGRKEAAVRAREYFGFFRNQEKVDTSVSVGRGVERFSFRNLENSTLKMATNFERPDH